MFDRHDARRWESRTFPATADAPAQARHALQTLLDRLHLNPAAGDDIRLLVSELVTNAVKHSGTDEVSLAVRPGDPLRFGVRDNGHGDPHIRNDNGAGGFGLQLVEQVASRWGVEKLPNGKIVWFDMPVRLD